MNVKFKVMFNFGEKECDSTPNLMGLG